MISCIDFTLKGKILNIGNKHNIVSNLKSMTLCSSIQAL